MNQGGAPLPTNDAFDEALQRFDRCRETLGLLLAAAILRSRKHGPKGRQHQHHGHGESDADERSSLGARLAIVEELEDTIDRHQPSEQGARQGHAERLAPKCSKVLPLLERGLYKLAIGLGNIAGRQVLPEI